MYAWKKKTTKTMMAQNLISQARSKSSLLRRLTSQAPNNEASEELIEQLGFKKVEKQLLKEYKSTAVLYRHIKSGAEVMSVANKDENKVFGIVFRTPPRNSAGIAHILERSLLCGSRKYPLKKPFTEVLKCSLQTFLNSTTYPDRTCHSVASTNLKDFYNLIDVYLDAMFFPKCMSDMQIFQQEGWHYELSESVKEVTIKGAVFTSMKKVYSKPENALGRACLQAMYPDSTYAFDSGGDPVAIRRLTYREFQEFYTRYYHPGNARIWFYGDDDPNERLRLISAYLDGFDASQSPKDSEVMIQKPFSRPKRVTEKYAADDLDDLRKKYMVCVNWVLADTTLDQETELALYCLDDLMLGTPAAPLHKALVESRLGEALVGGGLHDDILQPHFSVGLKNVAADDVLKVENLITSKLKEFVDIGFRPEDIEASINVVEFSIREKNSSCYPLGFSLMLRSMGNWLYGQDPFTPLKFAKALKALKTQIALEGSRALLSPIIQEFLLDNPHKVTVVLEPDPGKGRRDQLQETEMLKRFKKSLTKEGFTELKHGAEKLRLKQDTPDPSEALATIPSLSLDDIPKEPFEVPLNVGEIRGATVLQHDLFTNGVLYVDVAFDLSSIEPKLLPLMPLFCKCVMNMGTKGMDSIKLNQLIGRKTGGINASLTSSAIRGRKEASSHMIIRGKTVRSQIQDLFELMRILLQDVQLTDQKFFKQAVSESKNLMKSVLIEHGHNIAALRMDAKLNVAGWVTEQMGGLSHYDYLQTLEKQVDTGWHTVIEALEVIRYNLLSRRSALVNLTADNKLITRAEPHVSSLLQAFPDGIAGKKLWDTCLDQSNEGLVIPTRVNYVGKAYNIYNSGYRLHGSAHVISRFISNTWLWDRIRHDRGAYGSFCDFDTQSGSLLFLSYQDPNLLETLDVYDNTVQYLRDLQLDKESLRREIIGTIGDIDSYQLPHAKGFSSMLWYLRGITEEQRRIRRQEILSTRLSDFKEFADVLEIAKAKSVIVAVASHNDIVAANKLRPGLLNVRKTL